MSHELVEWANAVARTGGGLLVQSSVLIAVGLAVACFAAKGAAARSAIHRATLVAVAALPLVGVALSYAGLSLLAVPFPEAKLVEEQAGPAVAAERPARPEAEAAPAAQAEPRTEPIPAPVPAPACSITASRSPSLSSSPSATAWVSASSSCS